MSGWGTHPVRTYWPYESDEDFRENQPWLYLASIEHSKAVWHINDYAKHSIRICRKYLEKHGYTVIEPETPPMEHTNEFREENY